MARSFFLVAGLLLVGIGSGFAQSTLPARTLAGIPREIEARPDGVDPLLAAELDGVVEAATLIEIKQTLPGLVALSESSNANHRAGALLVLCSVAGRQKAGLPENRRERDIAADEALIPYISRLKPRLTDPATFNRRLSLTLFQALAVVRPAPRDLLEAALAVLQDPHSTQTVPDTRDGAVERRAPSLGPQMLRILLDAGATFSIDPATNITEGRDSAEVQQAIITFLHRPDQTSESLSESIRALALAQAQNPAVNGTLVALLDSLDVTVQQAFLQQIAGLTLSPEDFATARAGVTRIATDPKQPIELRRLATSLLPCWCNDRHRGTCPASGS